MIILLGDVHNYTRIIQHAGAIELSNCDLIQVGDFGVGGFDVSGSDDYRLKELNKFLIQQNIFLHVIRGNHDNPDFFKGNHRNVYSNIDFIPDYTIKQIQDKNILFIGGATSIDRKANPNVPDVMSPTGFYRGRKIGVDYWNDEALLFEEEKLRAVRGIDVVITHSAPGFVPPYLKTGAEKWFESDPELEEEINVERRNLSDAYFILKQNNKISSWFFGHFHFHVTDYYNNTMFRCLDILEFYELR